MKIRALITVIILSVLFCGCTGNSFINSSTEDPAIRVKDNMFDVSVDECIDLLNQEIASENLTQIPKDYVVIEHDGWKVYKVMVSKNIMFRLVTYDAEGKGIVRIGLSILDSFEYENGEKKVNTTISSAEKKASKRYYEIVCNLVRPNFNAKPFMQTGELGTTDFDLDGIIFLSNIPSSSGGLYENDKGSGSENVRVYEVISSKSLYEKYKDTIIGDNDIFFYIFHPLSSEN